MPLAWRRAPGRGRSSEDAHPRVRDRYTLCVKGYRLVVNIIVVAGGALERVERARGRVVMVRRPRLTRGRRGASLRRTDVRLVVSATC